MENNARMHSLDFQVLSSETINLMNMWQCSQNLDLNLTYQMGQKMLNKSKSGKFDCAEIL